VERHHVWSKDGGETWSDPDTFIPELSEGGRALWNDMVVDNAGVLHAVSIKQPWAAQWSGGWSQSVAIGSHSFAEDLRMTISNGNQLHVVWLEVVPEKLNQLYYVRGISSAPATLSEELPTLAPDALGNEPVATSTASLNVVEAVSPTVVDVAPVDVEAVASPARGVFLSAGVVILFLAVLIYILRRRSG
jgi:hypothetical protein